MVARLDGMSSLGRESALWLTGLLMGLDLHKRWLVQKLTRHACAGRGAQHAVSQGKLCPYGQVDWGRFGRDCWDESGVTTVRWSR